MLGGGSQHRPQTRGEEFFFFFFFKPKAIWSPRSPSGKSLSVVGRKGPARCRDDQPTLHARLQSRVQHQGLNVGFSSAPARFAPAGRR
jgi:hypothetical protein